MYPMQVGIQTKAVFSILLNEYISCEIYDVSDLK